MNMKYTKLILAVFLFGALSSVATGQSKCADIRQPGTANDNADTISINNIQMWIGNNGLRAHNPVTDAGGLEWPRGSGKTVIFSDALQWGGTLQGEIRVGGASYRYGLQGGPILPDGTPDDPAAPDNRIYKIRKLNAISFDSALTSAERARLRADYMGWPVQDGAPWVDKNRNGRYDPVFDDWLEHGDTCHSDTPLLIGDEVLWFVSNDMDPVRTSKLYGTQPVGLEVQTMVWGYDQPGPLSNMVFMKYTIINKGAYDFSDLYFSTWSDPDLGAANDDFCGIDTNAILAYSYNATERDDVYGIPPAMGYDFLQTPVVRASAADVARYGFGVRQGYANVPASSFTFYKCGDGVYRSPDLGVQSGAVQTYNNMQGFTSSGQPVIDPHTGKATKFCLAGDPVTGTGWIDGQARGAGDCGFLASVGPCSLARNDTQEVIIATIVGRGSDRLNSIQVLRYYDRVAQALFDRNFVLPSPPPQPQVAATEQPGEIILHWGAPDDVHAIENFRDQDYAFEGYNVYQFPSATASLSEATRIATFDKVNNVAVIFDDVIDEKSGALLSLPVQFGSDIGIQHIIEITNDALTGESLRSFQPYYFAVTAYAYAPDKNISPRQIESRPTVIEVRPQTWNPGVQPGAGLRERIPVRHTLGDATGGVEVEVVDPLRLTGDTYEVSFTSLGQAIVIYDGSDTLWLDNYGAWNLTNITRGNVTIVAGSQSFRGLVSDYFVVDGFRIGVTGSGCYEPEKEVLRQEWIGGPEVYTVSSGGLISPEAGYLFFGSSIPGYEIKETVEIRFDRDKTSNGYLYLRGGASDYAYQGYFSSPVQVYDVSDPKNERQLQWAFVEQSGSAANDSLWAPTTSPSDREYLFILRDTYSETPNPTYAGYKINSDAAKMPILYAAWVYQNRNDGPKFPWQNGDIWRIVPNVPFGPDDHYTFTTAAPTNSVERAKREVSSIQVFPNPYIDVNEDGSPGGSGGVTFTHVPQRALVRIYTVSGMLVRSLKKDDPGQTLTWNLRNENMQVVAPGMYIIHVALPDLGEERVLKLGVGTMYSVMKANN